MSAARPDFRVLPESVLVLAAQANDRAAFAELVRRREGWLRALLGRLCNDVAEGDDLAQETFLRAWRSLGRLREPTAFGVWLRRLAVNLFIDARRLRQIQVDDAAIAENVAGDELPPDCMAGARIDLERALALLSPAERICVVLNLGEGLSHGEIVEIVAMPLGTVKSHIQRGTAKVRRILGDHDE